MFDIIEDTHVVTDGLGYSGLRAAQYAKEHGLILVVMTPPETWEYDATDTETW